MRETLVNPRDVTVVLIASKERKSLLVFLAVDESLVATHSGWLEAAETLDLLRIE